MIKKLEKVIVISDIHLGEKECLFNDASILKKFKNSLSKEGQVDELIILGDLFDLSLVPFNEVYKKAREFFGEIGQLDNLNNIVFVPGNHDHHIWTLLIEEEQIIKKIRNGEPVSEQLNRVDLEYGEREGTFLDNLISGTRINKFLVSYPNLFREIGGSFYFLHHGHLLDRLFVPANIVLKPESLQELEAFNSSWIEGIWYHLGQAERLGRMVNKGYKEFLEMKTLLDVFLNKFNVSGNITGRLRGFKTDKLTKEINDYIEDCIEWYRETPARFYSPMNFIFGHTHKKCDGESVKIKGMDINIYNTGAWHGDIKLSSYILIDEKFPEPVLKNIY